MMKSKKTMLSFLSFQSGEASEVLEVEKDISNDWDRLLLVLSVICLFLSFVYKPLSNIRFELFITAGILQGIYFGINNNYIFHYPHKKNLPPEDNSKARTNTFWVHLICGVVGTTALYFLSSHINFACPIKTVFGLNWQDFALFVIAILGYTGLLPMTLWFFANSGKILEGLIKR